MACVIFRRRSGGEAYSRVRAHARPLKSAHYAAQRVDEPVELDGLSYSAEVLSTVEG